ncbi:MAG: InlB B-repeat-containing protein [Candidatus Dojkabacteria bacterium]
MNKKKKLLVFLLVPVLFFSVGVLTWYVVKSKNLSVTESNASAPESYRFSSSDNTADKDVVTYIVDGPGEIKGNTKQFLAKGKWGTRVEAIPNEGAEFRGWSRTSERPIRADIGNGNDRTIIAYFQKKGEERHMVEYIIKQPKLGSFADNTTSRVIQYLKEGEKGREVTVKPLEGAEFVGWSDGKTTTSRTEIGDGSSTMYVATFKKKDEKRGKITYKSEIKYVNTSGGAWDGSSKDVVRTETNPPFSNVYIEGENTQYLLDGESGRSVIARPMKCWIRFFGWDDGWKKLRRKDVGDGESKTITAIFLVYENPSISCATPPAELEYKADNSNGTMGFIRGTRVQDIGPGGRGTAVRALAYNGYRFKYWEKAVDMEGCKVGRPGVHDCEPVWKKDTGPQAGSQYRIDHKGKYRAVFEKKSKNVIHE